MTENIASLIDHTLLKPDATADQVRKLCEEAREHGFYSVCLNPYWLPTARKLLAGSAVKLCTVVGFPLGASLSKTKVQETAAVVEAGADEIDMVMNIGAARDGHWDFIRHEIHDVVSAAKGRPVKVILEISLLNEAQIRQACLTTVEAGAHFVKTSTGFAAGGATVEAVKLMRKAVGCEFGVKASGGIRDRAAAERMIEAGATRLGTSASVSIVQAETAAMA
jgi:deoxyribose-phosphate aldolase